MLKIFHKTLKNYLFCWRFCASLCVLLSRLPRPLASWRGKGEREKRRRCYRWWIPLWTVSFPAECVQWARARSWNLANETHPPRVPRHPTGWGDGSGGDDWLTESCACCCQSELRIKLTVFITSTAHREEAKWAKWNVYSKVWKIIKSEGWRQKMSFLL